MQAYACHWYEMNYGIDFNYARYNFNDIATQSGYLAGAHFDAAFKSANKFYTGVNFDGRWNAGLISSSFDLNNPNALQGGNTQASVADYLADWEVGYFHLTCNERWSISPFTGIGFQHLRFRFKPDALTYKYNQVYIPIGLQWFYHSPRNITIGCRAIYRAGAYTTLHVATPNLGDNDRLELRYSQGVNVLIPITLHYREDKCVGLNFSMIPFFDWNHFAFPKETNSQGLAFPVADNKRWYLGMNVNIGMVF